MAAHAVVSDRPVDEWSDGPSLSLCPGDRIEVEPIAESLTRRTLPWGGVKHQIVVREIRTATRRDTSG